MWQRGENNFRGVQRGIFSGDVSDFGRTDPRALTALLIGRREGQLQARVSCDQTAQLPARVPTGTEHSDRNFMHKECITLHSVPVNDPLTSLADSHLTC